MTTTEIQDSRRRYSARWDHPAQPRSFGHNSGHDFFDDGYTPESPPQLEPHPNVYQPTHIFLEVNDSDESDNENDCVIIKQEIAPQLNARCKICMDEFINVTLIPCGHLVMCMTCAKSMYYKKIVRVCPVCRKGVEKAVKTFF